VHSVTAKVPCALYISGVGSGGCVARIREARNAQIIVMVKKRTKRPPGTEGVNTEMNPGK
jgi:hypothetical protein